MHGQSCLDTASKLVNEMITEINCHMNSFDSTFCQNSNAKPPSFIRILGLVDGHKKCAIVAREVNFGAEVAPTFWSKRLAIETTTSIDISVLNDLVHTWQFQCEIVF